MSSSSLARVRYAAVRLDDAAGMARLTANLPDGARLIAKLREGRHERATCYHGCMLYLIAHDGETVIAISIAGLTAGEAAAIARSCDGLDEWSAPAFRSMLESLGGQFRRLQ